MHALLKSGLNLVQKAGLDETMIRISGSNFVKDAIFKFGWHHEGYDHVRRRYEYLRSKLEKGGAHVSFIDKNILEIGAGNSVGLGYFFFNEGYRSWTASDHGRSPNETARIRTLEYRLATRLAQERGNEIRKFVNLRNGRIEFLDKIRFRTIDLARHEPELDKKFDIIFSIAVLEHVPKEEMDRSIRNMGSYLADGGIMIHSIDLKDHVNPLNPFGFYKYSEERWNKLTRGTIFYTNRLRTKDYINLLEKNELPVVYCERYKPFELPKNIGPDFTDNYSEEDLQAGEVFLISAARVADAS
jgi:hypothetical protein